MNTDTLLRHGTKLLDPAVEVDDIVFMVDQNQEYNVGRLMNEWGKSQPVVKINDYVCSIGEVESCHVYITLGKLPRFELQVKDTKYDIREALKKEIDKCTIFLGYTNWYIKFNGIIETIDSNSGDSQIYMTGIFYDKDLHTPEQKIWNEKSIIEIIKEICTQTKMGLYIFDNTELNNILDIVINPNISKLAFTKQLLERYTTNLFCYDAFGFLHIGDLATIRQQPFDKITISPRDGSEILPTDLCFKTRKLEYQEGEELNKIIVDHYTICNNFSLTHLHNATKYSLLFSNDEILDLASDEEVGYGLETENTFAGFSKHKFPFRDKRINKLLNGYLIKLNVRQVIYELTPFSVVNLELYMPALSSDKDEKTGQVFLDEEHSGKRVVIGFSYDYEKETSDSSENHIEQNIYLI